MFFVAIVIILIDVKITFQAIPSKPSSVVRLPFLKLRHTEKQIGLATDTFGDDRAERSPLLEAVIPACRA